MRHVTWVAIWAFGSVIVNAQYDPNPPREVWAHNAKTGWSLQPNPARMGLYLTGPTTDPKAELRERLKAEAERAASAVSRPPEEWRRINEQAARLAAEQAKKKADTARAAAETAQAERIKLDKEISDLLAKRAKLHA